MNTHQTREDPFGVCRVLGVLKAEVVDENTQRIGLRLRAKRDGCWPSGFCRKCEHIVAVLQNRVPLRQWHPTYSDAQAVISLIFMQLDLPLISSGLTGRSTLRGSYSLVY